jgi:hypothetical protein
VTWQTLAFVEGANQRPERYLNLLPQRTVFIRVKLDRHTVGRRPADIQVRLTVVVVEWAKGCSAGHAAGVWRGPLDDARRPVGDEAAARLGRAVVVGPPTDDRPARRRERYSRMKASGRPGGRRGLVAVVEEVAVVVVAVARSGFSRWHAMRSMSWVASGVNLATGERLIR